MKNKILYLMGVDWKWIYQRPQIIAERLDEDFDVTVIYPHKVQDIKLPKDSNTKIKKRKMYVVPFQEKNILIRKVANYFQKKIFADYQTYDYIFIGHPTYINFIPEDYAGYLIYDCMDNYAAMFKNAKRARRIAEQELLSVKRCDLLFASSQELCRKVNKIAGQDKAILLRNAVTIDEISDIKEPKVKKRYEIGYIGTIAEWFDYSKLICSLKDNELPICYNLIGPVIGEGIGKVDGINYAGVVQHSDLNQKIQSYDCLVMPFIINDIVLAVDPVKLYEYIAFGKCIICVYYEELEYFKDFVYFYRSEEEYMELLRWLCKEGFPPKYNKNMQVKFLKENSWEQRYSILKSAILNFNSENN